MNQNPAWKIVFVKFWLTQALSLFGSGLASFAVIWWVTQTTGSSATLATLSLATLLPGVLIGPLAGALVDQLNRKWIMVVADAVSALLALVLVVLFWTGGIQLWHIYLINVLRSLAGVFQFPAVQSSTSLMVPKEQLARVAGLNQALQGLNMIATPPLGALLLTLLPLHFILGIDLITAALAILLLLTIHIPQLASRQPLARVPSTVWREMRAGFAFLLNWSALTKILGIAALLNLVLIPAFTLVPILVTENFGGSALQLGWLNAAYGIGIIGGGALLGAWGGFKRRIHTSLLGLVGLGIGSFLIWIAPRDGYWIAVTGMTMIGVMNALANGPFFAILQNIVPPEIQGRVFTVLMSVSTGAAPVGLALAGPFADALGVQVWYLLGALICAGITLWILFTPEILHLEETPITLETVKDATTHAV